MAGNPKNIIPNSERTPEERKRIASNGGKKSAKVRRERKLLSQMYADLLADQSGIMRGKGFNEVVRDIMNNQDPKNNPSRVSLIKEIREATEGNKLKTESTINVNAEDPITAELIEKYGIKPKN